VARWRRRILAGIIAVEQDLLAVIAPLQQG
jgi:hypothetical protein